MLASCWYAAELEVKCAGKERVALVGNRFIPGKERKDTVADNYSAADLTELAAVLDEYRRLGEADWRLNFGFAQ